MKLKRDKIRDNSEIINITRLAVLTALFVFGAVIGSILGAEVKGSEDWLWEYMHISPQNFFRRDTIINLIFLVIVFVGGFTSVAFIFTVAASVSKGIIASVPITAFVRLYGVSGYFIAAENGMFSNFTAFISLLIMSIYSAESSSKKRLGIKNSESDKQYALILCICSSIIIFGAAIDGFLV